MSFSSEVKKELVRLVPPARHCRLSELSALVSMSGVVKDGSWWRDEENSYADEKMDRLAELLSVTPVDEAALRALKLSSVVDGRYVADPILTESSCCKQAYVRGAFLACGSLTDPEKGYHFEIACDNRKHAEYLMRILTAFSLHPKTVERKRYHVVYIKESQEISDLLNLMGAHHALMDMENVRILKDMKNRVNRRVNCETANLNKTVSAAVRQIEDITYIRDTRGLSALPKNLQQLAELRLSEPDITLAELGERLDPPLGKSGVNHRLRKISEIADELRTSHP